MVSELPRCRLDSIFQTENLSNHQIAHSKKQRYSQQKIWKKKKFGLSVKNDLKMSYLFICMISRLSCSSSMSCCAHRGATTAGNTEQHPERGDHPPQARTPSASWGHPDRYIANTLSHCFSCYFIGGNFMMYFLICFWRISLFEPWRLAG